MADLNEMLVAWTGEIDSFMYTYILVILLVFVGVYYTIRTKAGANSLHQGSCSLS